jgi:fructose/tagatose bisphosphate aldolase
MTTLREALGRAQSTSTAVGHFNVADGINIVHINTELRAAWRRGLEQALSGQPHEVVPYKILPSAVESVGQVALARLRLFTSA